MRYVELMDAMQFELAAEYLLMAAMLAEIKSRMLLPRAGDSEEDEEDPRANLVRRLQEYERFKKAAEDLEAMPRLERELWQASAAPPDLHLERPLPDVDMREVLLALGEVAPRRDVCQPPDSDGITVDTRAHVSSPRDAEKWQFCAFRHAFHARGRTAGCGGTFWR